MLFITEVTLNLSEATATMAEFILTKCEVAVTMGEFITLKTEAYSAISVAKIN